MVAPMVVYAAIVGAKFAHGVYMVRSAQQKRIQREMHQSDVFQHNGGGIVYYVD